MCREPSLWHMSLYIACNTGKVTVAGVEDEASEVADVLGIICELVERQWRLKQGRLNSSPDQESVNLHSS